MFLSHKIDTPAKTIGLLPPKRGEVKREEVRLAVFDLASVKKWTRIATLSRMNE